jgi:ATP-binding cassette subfamily B protein/subfamily B ATP-binding cassette protein MsbA
MRSPGSEESLLIPAAKGCQTKPVMATLRRYARLLPYTWRQWPALLLILGLTAVTSGLVALQPWPIKILVDYALGDLAVPARFSRLLQYLSPGPLPTTLIAVAAAASLGLFVLNSLLEVGLTWAWAATGQRLVYDLAAQLFYQLQRLSLLFHSQRTVGDLLSRLTGDVYCIYTVTDALLIAPWQHLFTLVTIGAIAWHIDPTLTLIAMVAAPVMAGSVLFFGPRLQQQGRQDRVIQSRLLNFVHQTLTAIPVVQAFGTEGQNRRRFQYLAEDAVSLSQRGTFLQNTYVLINGLIITITTAVVLYAGGLRVLSGALSVGSILVFLSYLQSMQKAFEGLLGIYGSLKMAEAGIDRVMEVLEVKEGVREAVGAEPLPVRSVGERGHVYLEGISFGYEPGHPVLQQITLEAHPGETVALVGPTGAGKSTLVSLIPRFFDPWEGRVLFDGVDVRQVQLASLRAQIALVLQEPFLLPLTVAENIAYGRPEASREEIVAAAVAANADEFIRHLPRGYDTVLGERGATLSGGQRQRLAIARALLKDVPVLILDEPTAALDAQTETLLLEALERLLVGRTTFVIAHRLSTVRQADRIVVLDKGTLVETGTHQELLTAHGLYHRLYDLQYGGMRAAI